MKNNKEFIVCKYRIKVVDDYSFEEAMEIITTEESIGIESIAFEDKIRIYPGITTFQDYKAEKYTAKYEIIEMISKQEGIVNIYYPTCNLIQDHGIINVLFSTIMGDLFGLEVVEDIFLESIKWNDAYLNEFKGPKFGIEGIKTKLNVETPMVGAIVKPNLGLTPKELGELVYNLALGGANFIKDDELLSSTKDSNIFERLEYALDGLKRAEKITGKKALFALNITSDGSKTIDIAKEAVRRGANCLMLNVFAAGFDTLRELSICEEINVPIHTHRCIHDIYTSRKNYGVSLSIFSELARLCGADFFHIGTVVGKEEDSLREIYRSYESLTSTTLNFKRTLPISSRVSILSLKRTSEIIKNRDIMYLACGSIYKNPLPIDQSVRVLKEGVEYVYHDVDNRSSSYFITEQFLKELYYKI